MLNSSLVVIRTECSKIPSKLFGGYIFGDILKDIMLEEGMTQIELAQRIGVKQSQVSDWINNKNRPGYYSLKLIAVKLNVSADRLLGIVDDMPRM